MMKSAVSTGDLLKLCLEIDRSMLEMYRRISSFADHPELKAFWSDIIRDEDSHLHFWQSVIDLKYPDGFLGDAGELRCKYRHLRRMFLRLKRMYHDFQRYDSREQELFLAYTGELYLFDPVFIEILYSLVPLSGKMCRSYGRHTMKFIHAMRRFGNKDSSVIELSGEILRNLYDLNLRLYRESVTDSLTGLLNRRGFFRSSVPYLALAGRRHAVSAVLILDLDHFKRVNDSYGHSAGDTVLKTVADLIRSGVRSTDLVGRYGGEEFILLCSPVCINSLETLCERLRERIEKHSGGESGIPVTVSIGGALGRIDESGVLDLIFLADSNLFKAKDKGRNNCHIETLPAIREPHEMSE